ncbi:MAG: hypothetical protein R2749_07560 [Acidimicrobiales bacterium]
MIAAADGEQQLAGQRRAGRRRWRRAARQAGEQVGVEQHAAGGQFVGEAQLVGPGLGEAGLLAEGAGGRHVVPAVMARTRSRGWPRCGSDEHDHGVAGGGRGNLVRDGPAHRCGSGRRAVVHLGVVGRPAPTT